MIDVVIVAYRSDATLPACLAGAAEVVAGGGAILVVDNGGSELVAEQAAAVGATVITRHDNPGFGASQNLGIAATSAPYVLMLNPDAVPDAAAVKAGAAVLDDGPNIAAVQGGIVDPAGGMPDRSAGAAIGPHHLVGRVLGGRRLLATKAGRSLARLVPSLRDHAERVVPEMRDVEALAATALLVRRSAFEEVGGFDPRYFLYGEDVDLSRRLRSAGWRLVALPDTWATHVHGSSALDSFDGELNWWRGAMRYAAQWWPAPSFAVALAAAAGMWVRLAARRPKEAALAWRALVGSARSTRRQRPQPWSGSSPDSRCPPFFD